MRLLFPLPRNDALARDKAQSFIYFGKETPCVLRHDGNEYHPIFGPTIPVIPNTRVQGRFDLWTVRLLAVTLLVPPSDDSPTWTPIRIDMPNNGVRAILDTASMNSTFSPTTIKSMCDRWFTVGDSDDEQTEQAHADRERFSDHDLVFTFEGTDGAPVDFRCDAAWFFCRLWEDKESRELFRWSHVRSSNDDESDIVVLGMNFFWGAFVKFSAPYEGSDTVPSIQFAAQRAVVEGQKIHGPWDFTFAK
uniref:Uncharacterized protein n=1 Tax=Ganoderma boninense TaxID=34458 RepID=A0A5K1JYB2_9APHY|nr:Eukaryotic translation initiation factor 3 subunit G (eIF3g) (Eukaryotic translation initiation factor 3 RNA-binding subunit) (eIF-3 RNA-binding subunit) (Translation initiation factor eIF3 p33 subunit homolog) (eIF3 p33 homolog) [Ganoderma boninense]